MSLSLLLAAPSLLAAQPSTKIFGGKTVDAPISYQVMLVNSEWKQQVCGGVLVSEKHVLTAAHCVVRYPPVPEEWYVDAPDEDEFEEWGSQAYVPYNETSLDLYVHVGITDKFRDLPGECRQKQKVARIHRVAEYNMPHIFDDQSGPSGDIVLLELEEKFQLNDVTRPALLPVAPHQNYSSNGSSVTVSGWGRLSAPDYTPAVSLQVYDTPMHPNCAPKYFEEMGEKYNTSLAGCPEDQFFAGVPGSGKDACSGDSGGPAVLKGTNILLGLVSWSYKPCGDGHVFQSVFPYLEEIRRVMNSTTD